MEQETIEIQKELFDQRKSKLEKYQELIVGRKGFSGLIKYEFIMTVTPAHVINIENQEKNAAWSERRWCKERSVQSARP